MNVPSEDYTTTIADVGALLPSRTVDRRQNQLGTFTDETTPKAATVTGLISEATDEVVGLVGPLAELPDGPREDDPDSIRKMGKRAVGLLAAMNVELTAFPEQIGGSNGRSPYPHLKDRYDSLMKRLEAAIESAGGSVPDSDDDGGAGSRYPSYSFPAEGGGSIGWGTHF